MSRLFNLTVKVAIAVLILMITAGACQKENNSVLATENEKVQANITEDSLDCYCLINPSPTVSEAEIEILLFMREEEKLARDVYLAMHELYDIPIFKNIAKSEQHHMNQVLCLLQFYNIPDPASPDTGIFANSDLQTLYGSLVQQGNISLIEALKAGALIEDKDIFDLESDMNQTENPAILNTFSRLSCASGNHLHSFTKWLTSKGITYVPQLLSQQEYDEIITLPHQFCGNR